MPVWVKDQEGYEYAGWLVGLAHRRGNGANRAMCVVEDEHGSLSIHDLDRVTVKFDGEA